MPTPKPRPGGSPYEDPFQWAHVTPERVDMGVDYSGRGPVTAIGPGIITEADTAWAHGMGAVGPGVFVKELITSGPAAGQSFYYAEELQSVTVHKGQHVKAGQHIADFMPGGQTEFGWAANRGLGLTKAAQANQYDWKGDPTAFGVSASEFLHSTGAPAGIVHGKPSGTLPANWYPSGNIPVNGKTTSIVTDLLGGALLGGNWKDLAQRLGLILLGAALIILGILLLAGKNSIKIAMAGVAPEATLAEQVKANAVAMRAKGEASVNS